MKHILIRAETRDNERRVGITPIEAKQLIKGGFQVSIEESKGRIIPVSEYIKVGCTVLPENSWINAHSDTIIFGLKELPEDPYPLEHRHIMFGHAFKEQPSAKNLLKRFKVGGGILYDIEYLLNQEGKRVAAFGYWAGYVGAAVTLSCWISQKENQKPKNFSIFKSKDELDEKINNELKNSKYHPKNAIVIGALGRVGKGVIDLCKKMNIKITKWDISETIDKTEFPEIINHELLFNCVVANKKTPTFISKNLIKKNQNLSLIGDISCDPGSEYNPIAIYNDVTTWKQPVMRITENPILEVMAIDNLPSLLPYESSIDFASQIIPFLMTLDEINDGIWEFARQIFLKNLRRL